MSFMVSFFVCFHVNSSYVKVRVRFNIVIRSNHIRPYAVDLKFYILYIFFIIKYVSLESIIFIISLYVALSSKNFNTFNYIFLSIILLT